MLSFRTHDFTFGGYFSKIFSMAFEIFLAFCSGLSLRVPDAVPRNTSCFRAGSNISMVNAPTGIVVAVVVQIEFPQPYPGPKPSLNVVYCVCLLTEAWYPTSMSPPVSTFFKPFLASSSSSAATIRWPAN